MDVRRTIETPVGEIDLVANDDALVGLFVRKDVRAEAAPAPKKHAVLDRVEKELAEYFAGKRTRFTVKLAPRGTEFQRAVWMLLRDIPFGETCSYVDIARRLGKPTASRAVGAANGQNPISIIVPCHRVIGANGSLTGYAGGLERKHKLLSLEGAL